MRRFGWITIAAITCSCSSAPAPVPVSGSAAQMERLAGSWAGEYSSLATGRYGNIRFTLAAGSDTAHGDVVMVPRNARASQQQGNDRVVASPANPATIRIAFVRAAGDSVIGQLEPYLDPDCACTLETSFHGRLSGDHIEGSYGSRNVQTGERAFGTWKVKRQRDAGSR